MAGVMLPVEREQEAEDLLARIIVWDDKYIRMVSHPDEKRNPVKVRKYFNNLIDSAAEEIQQVQAELEKIYDSLSNWYIQTCKRAGASFFWGLLLCCVFALARFSSLGVESVFDWFYF